MKWIQALFEPFLKSFFVRNSDPTHIKLVKLEILTNLATEASAGLVLRELHTYVSAGDRPFAAATIHAIGRLALAIHTETDTCLNGLLHLLSSKDGEPNHPYTLTTLWTLSSLSTRDSLDTFNTLDRGPS